MTTFNPSRAHSSLHRPEVVDAIASVLGASCYACDEHAVGLRDRRPEGGRIESACERHRELDCSARGAS